MTTVRKNLTDEYARRAAPETKHWDTRVKGFHLACGKTSRTWYLQRDEHGRTLRHKLGSFPDVTAAEARKAAERIVGAANDAPAPVKAPTLAATLDAYLSRSKLRSDDHKKIMRRVITTYLSDWMPLPLDRITKEMVRERFESIKATPRKEGATGGSVFMANEAMQHFRTVYNHAEKITSATLPRCPTIAIEFDQFAPKKDNFANRLTEWKAAVESVEQPIHRVIYRFLLTTGLRKTECLSLTWGVEGEDLDTVTHGRVYSDRLYLPVTKNGRAFTLPLMEEHQRLLDPVRGLSSRWLFPAWRGEPGHVVGPTRIGFTLQAHRRTFATIAQNHAKLSDEQVGRLLNHTPESVTGKHYVGESLDALRELMIPMVETFKRLHLI